MSREWKKHQLQMYAEQRKVQTSTGVRYDTKETVWSIVTSTLVCLFADSDKCARGTLLQSIGWLMH